MRLGIVAHRATSTNLALAAEAQPGVEAIVLPPLAALHLLRPGDVALGRLDVRESVDGVEDGLWHLERLACAGVTVFNSSPTLRLGHDKRLTATVLTGAGLPHPRTVSVRDGRYDPPLPFPFVLKPRFGSWGTDVVLCDDEEAWLRAVSSLSTRAWYSRCGALAQELVPPLGGDLVGVDLLPTGPGTYVVLEVNGAVDFTGDYAPGGNVFAAAVGTLVGAPQLAAIA